MDATARLRAAEPLSKSQASSIKPKHQTTQTINNFRNNQRKIWIEASEIEPIIVVTLDFI